MKIRATYGIYDNDPTAIALIHTLDEYEWQAISDEEVDKLVNAALRERPDITDTRSVWVNVPDSELEALFATREIDATTEPAT